MLESMNQDIVRRIAAGRKLPAGQGARAAGAAPVHRPRKRWRGPRRQAGAVERRQRALALERGNDDFELVDATPKKKAQEPRPDAILGDMF